MPTRLRCSTRLVEALRRTTADGMATVGNRALPASGFFGVRANGNKWRAELRYNGKCYPVGTTFGSKEEAAIAYDRAAKAHRQVYPSCVPLNFDGCSNRRSSTKHGFKASPAPTLETQVFLSLFLSPSLFLSDFLHVLRGKFQTESC